MTTAFYLTVLASALALLIYIWTSILVGRARKMYGVHAPATTGAEAFERAFRVQQNTMEQLVLFLPVLWIAYALTGTIWPALLGFIWVVGRIIYAFSYMSDPKKRAVGFLLTMIPSLILLGWILALSVLGLI